MTNPLNQSAFAEIINIEALPVSDLNRQGRLVHLVATRGGLNIREYAALTLRVPDSGIPELDAMILEARRLDYAGQALIATTAKLEYGVFYEQDATVQAYAMADAMIAERNKK